MEEDWVIKRETYRQQLITLYAAAEGLREKFSLARTLDELRDDLADRYAPNFNRQRMVDPAYLAWSVGLSSEPAVRVWVPHPLWQAMLRVAEERLKDWKPTPRNPDNQQYMGSFEGPLKTRIGVWTLGGTNWYSPTLVASGGDLDFGLGAGVAAKQEGTGVIEVPYSHDRWLSKEDGMDTPVPASPTGKAPTRRL
jgi:hypothetical protein